jgi:hypothetical protein
MSISTMLTDRLPKRQPNHYHAKSSFQTLVGSCMTATHYGEDWVPKIRVPKGNTQTWTEIWVWVGLGLCLNSMVIFGLGTHKFQNFGFFWVLPLGTQEYWVPKIWEFKGNTQTVIW